MKTVWTMQLPVSTPLSKREFHVARDARDRYEIDSSLFSLHGTLLIADIGRAQRVAHTINQKRDVARFPESAVTAGELYIAGLLDELLHLLVVSYLEQTNANVFSDALEYLGKKVGKEELNATLRRFSESFPPTSVYKGEQKLDDYFEGETDGTPNINVVLEELLMLHLSNENPALERYVELFDDTDLERSTPYPQLIEGLQSFFEAEPGLLSGVSLFDMLRAPALASPTSLEGQLEHIRGVWSPLLGEKFDVLFAQVIQGLDVIREERKPGASFGPPGPAKVLEFGETQSEFVSATKMRELPAYERFSPDSSWMPRVVMLAKSTYVWLGQLSKKYERDISRLDQIPDEELGELARRGFTSLWLIGLWERSEASKRIKHLRGNPDAVASAYALYDYQIAHDLGGDEAYENLRDRAWGRGLRLASDMVPNHFGIDSRWVVEHPDWFLQLSEIPYPGYTFNGPDLSGDERIGIQIEDHYYDSSDAAVVFKRTDRWTGEERYIYHGNDGTVTPWNDTAQINYLHSEAREAVIQTILHVARKFSVIRFDAAMTLAKIHIQRLWFPEPGSGGAIASRAQYGSMSNEDFDRAMPEEFWREVVDRVAEEVPDTLLLAEAFWMMEPYFVRTLGMHRVYNSAFMHMFKDEDNEKYRLTIKNTLEFNPEILKRFVNFMNNPDEETAVAQFGKGDKYFGVVTVMVTMPGLPMFGHGQVEGYAEKYGMEYRRAKLDESPDSWLIDRHYREVFPLVHRRKEFAEVDNFLLYDLFTEGGGVNENVFAYSNSFEGKASLVLYNNAFAGARGWLKRSAAYRDTGSDSLRQRDLSDGLGLGGGDEHFVRWREHVSGLEYLKPSRDLQLYGLFVELGAYKCQVFLDVQEVHDVDGVYRNLYEQIGNHGVPSIEEALKDIEYQALYSALDDVVESAALDDESYEKDQFAKAYDDLLEELAQYDLELSKKEKKATSEKALSLVERLHVYPPLKETVEDVDGAVVEESRAATVEGSKTDALQVEDASQAISENDVSSETIASDVEEASLEESGQAESLGTYQELSKEVMRPLLLWSVSKSLESTKTKPTRDVSSISEKLRLVRYAERNSDWRQVRLLDLLVQDETQLEEVSAETYFEIALENDTVLNFLEVNEHASERWFNRDAYRWLSVTWLGKAWLEGKISADKYLELLNDFAVAEEKSGYKLGSLLPEELEAEKPEDDEEEKTVEQSSAALSNEDEIPSESSRGEEDTVSSTGTLESSKKV